jgi:hypothetical protein
MAFAQLTYRESLRDIEACLGSMQSKLYHMGFRGKVSRSTWRAPTNDETGESMPTLLRCSSVLRALCMLTIPWE